MIFLVTRGRPAGFKAFVQGCLYTKTTEPVVVRADRDDDSIREYGIDKMPGNWRLIIGDRVGMLACLNELFELFPNEDAYGFAADDMVPRTYAWDRKLKEACKPWGVSYGDDLAPDGKILGTHPWIAGELPRAIGFFTLPNQYRMGVDAFYREVGWALDRYVFVPGVITEHMHHAWGKSEYDATYRGRLDNLGGHVDGYAEFPEMIKRIKQKMKENGHG